MKYKLGIKDIGKYLVWKMRSNSTFSIDINFKHNSINLETPLCIFIVCQIDWYNKNLFKNNEYKSYLHPMMLSEAFSDRAWYNCDIESSINFGEAKVFDNLDEAYNYSVQKNIELLKKL